MTSSSIYVLPGFLDRDRFHGITALVAEPYFGTLVRSYFLV